MLGVFPKFHGIVNLAGTIPVCIIAAGSGHPGSFPDKVWGIRNMKSNVNFKLLSENSLKWLVFLSQPMLEGL